MEINLNEIRGNSLVRYGFRVLLAKEFGLYLKEQEVEKILLAESCIEVYEDVEEFLEKSGWRRDNPELCSECYLFENHIQLENTQYSKCERAVISWPKGCYCLFLL